jgi:hypothetical protein
MKNLVRLLVASLLMTAFAGVVFAVSAWPTSTSGVEIGSNVRAVYPAIEPSGLAWHSGRQQLLLVGDEGQLMAFNRDGSNVTLWNVGGDLEDVTVVDPSSNYVYLADEDGKIVKYNLATSSVAQSWSITSLMPEINGAGMEGLTYADGYFYAGYQLNGKIYVLDLSGSSVVKVGELAGLSGSGYTDLSGLHYRDGYLYALYSSTLAIMKTDGTVMVTYAVPGSDQEGLALGEDSNGDGDADMYIAQDSSGTIYDYDNFPIYGWTAPVVTDPDSDGDGVPASSDCNDNDASVSSLQTYYVDSDGDGLGSQTAVLLCSATAPSGYATNSLDAIDTIYNPGIEVVGDKVDNDGDGKVDEVNTVAENGYHPYYSGMDPSVSSTGKIKTVWGLGYGDFGVRYVDGSNYRYSLSDTTSRTKSKVTLIPGTAYANITVGTTVYKVNLYTGQAL